MDHAEVGSVCTDGTGYTLNFNVRMMTIEDLFEHFTGTSYIAGGEEISRIDDLSSKLTNCAIGKMTTRRAREIHSRELVVSRQAIPWFVTKQKHK